MHDDFYQMYLEELAAVPPCTSEEQEQLLAQAAGGDDKARERLIEGNLQTVLQYAKEFDGRGVLLTDLVQEANVALTMAVGEYLQGTAGLDFDCFVASKVKEALNAALEEELAADETGQELAARVNVLSEVSKALSADLGREPTVDELADKMKMTVDEVGNIMKMAMDAISMNAANMDLEALAGIEGMEITEDIADDEGILEEE